MSIIYKLTPGLYGLKKGKIISWHHCRDIFHCEAAKNNVFNFYFAHNKNQLKHIKDFINKVEEQLKLEERTEFVPENLEFCLVKTAPFWTWQDMKFSLFTILLRASLHHKGGNIDLESNEYLLNTKSAVNLFMSGRTKYAWWGGNWHRTFNGSENPENLLFPEWHWSARLKKWLSSFFG